MKNFKLVTDLRLNRDVFEGGVVLETQYIASLRTHHPGIHPEKFIV